MNKLLKNITITLCIVLFNIPVYAQQPDLPGIYQRLIKSTEINQDHEQSFGQQLLRAKEGLSILLSDLEQDINQGKDTTIRKKAVSAQLKAIETIEKEIRKVTTRAKAPTTIPLFSPLRQEISTDELKAQTEQILISPDISKIRQLKQKLPSKPRHSSPIYQRTDDAHFFEKGKGKDRLPQMLPRRVDIAEVKISGAPAPLSTAPEIQINQEIRDLVASLNNDYQQIFNWVQKNIDFQPYLGCAKGSILTLWDKAGNCADINALFCALLQAAGYTTNYIDASIIVSIGKIPDLAGVPDINDAYNILNSHELIEGVIGSPTVTHLIIAHFYTAVNTGTQTIYLDPSFKDYSFTQGIAVPYQQFDEEGYLANEKSYLPVERHEQDVASWLKANHPGSSTNDVFIKATITITQIPQPPLPYNIYQVHGTYTAIPDWAMHTVGIKAVYRYSDNTEDVIIQRRWYNLCDVAGKRISLSNEQYGNYYIPKIAVDGTVTQTSSYYFDPGMILWWVIDFKPLGHPANNVSEHWWQVGGTAVIGINPQSVSNRLIEERQAILINNRDNPQIAQEELLHLIVLNYLKDSNGSNYRAAGLNHYPYTRATWEAMAAQRIMVDGQNVIPTSLNIDVVRTPFSVFNVDDYANFSSLLGWQGSTEEHNIWEKLLEIPSISTTKGMQIAHGRNYTIYKVDSTNIDTLLPLINIPQYKKDDIKELVAVGNTVTIPDHEFYYNDWFGIIYLVEGSTGSGYMIWGETGDVINGGQTTVNPKQKDTTLGKDTNKQTTKDDPIDVATGNLDISATDIFIPGKIPFSLKRSYQSRSFRTSPYGWGWHYTYGLKLWKAPDATVFISGPEGQLWRFTPTAGGYTPQFGIYSTLIKTAGGHELREKNGITYTFDEQGNLIKIMDKCGNQLALTRDVEGKLISVQDNVGRALSFEYTNNRINKVTDPAGRQFIFTYSYDPQDMLIGVTDPAGKSTVYTYSSDHNLLTQTDPNDNLTMWLYYDQDRVYKRIGAGAGELTLKYNTQDMKTTFIDSLGKTTLFYYNTLGVVTKEIDPFGNQIQSTYDSNLNLTAKTDKNNQMTNMDYDSMGNTLSITDPKANTTYFSYEPTNNQVTSITDPLSHVTTFAYDLSGNLIKATDPLNNATIYTYDTYGNSTSMKDANGNTAQYSYDSYHNLITITDAKGGKTTFTYDGSGNRLTMTDANNNQTKYSWDNCNRLIKITYPDNSTAEYGYDGVGNRLTMKDQNGNVTQYSYDSMNRLTKITDPLSNATQYTYDTEGNRISLTDAEGHMTNYIYNSLNRLVQVKAADNTTTNFGYDAVGNRLSMTDAQGNATNYTYDEVKRLIQVIDAVGNATKYEYDSRGNLTKITDANNHATNYSYDALSRLKATTDPLANATQHSYDAVGNLISKTDANGTTTAYTYDAMNRLVEVSVVGTGLVPVRYAYDTVGNLFNMVDLTGTTQYGYDALNRLIKETHPNGYVVRYEYDTVGNRTKVIDPWNRGISYQYDVANRLVKVTDPQTKVTTYAYNKVGAPVELNYPNGVKTTYAYDNLNRLTLLKAQGTATINQFGYAYDNVGNRVAMTDKDGGITRYEYDGLYRLTKASYPAGSVTTYTYDGVGNRLTMNGVGYIYDVADRLLQAGATTYGYDANGNMINKTEDGLTTAYTYDYANRLISIRNSQSEIRNSYDGYGRRVSRLVKGGGFGIPEAQHTEYLWDGTNVLCEFYQNKGNPLEYVYGNGQLISRDDLLVLPVSKRLVYQNSYWFHQEGLGSVVNLTNVSGTVRLAYDYDAFGEITKEEGQVGWKKNRYTFTGKPYDPAAGMYYFGARWYEEEVGRFITKDPLICTPEDERIISGAIHPIIVNLIINQGLTNPQDTHSYMYCYNNPIGYVDLWGYCGKKQNQREWLKWLWEHGYIDVGFTGLAPGKLGAVINAGVIVAPSGGYGYYGFGLGGGAGWSATINIGTPPSPGVAVTGTARGGSGWGGYASGGVSEDGSLGGSVGGGVGIGTGYGVIITHTLPLWLWNWWWWHQDDE